MPKYKSVLDGHKLRFCTICQSVWENPYEQRELITLIKYSNLSSYQLPRKLCLECEREIDDAFYNNNRSRKLVTRYY